MMVYHHSGQVKVQNRNWNLTLSVFWMMKIRRTPDAGQRRDRPATQFAPVRLLPTPVAAGSKPNVDTSMAMTDRSARLYVPA